MSNSELCTRRRALSDKVDDGRAYSPSAVKMHSTPFTRRMMSAEAGRKNPMTSRSNGRVDSRSAMSIDPTPLLRGALGLLVMLSMVDLSLTAFNASTKRGATSVSNHWFHGLSERTCHEKEVWSGLGEGLDEVSVRGGIGVR